jgi:hypothetical protein
VTGILTFVISSQHSKVDLFAFQHKQIRKCFNSPQMVNEGKLSFEVINELADLKNIEVIQA